MDYEVYFANAGVPATGLTPTWGLLTQRDGGGAEESEPAFTELGGGWYTFSYSPTETMVGYIDGSDTLSDADRYVPFKATVSDEAINEVTAARMGALTDWINGERLDTLLKAIPTTPMRGTDGAVTSLTGVATEAKQDTAKTVIDTIAADVVNVDGSSIPTPSDIDTKLTSTHGAGSWAAPSPSDIDTQLTSTHGVGSWQSSGASGSNSVVVTVVDSLAAPIPDVSVTVLNSDETALLTAAVTDSLGQVSLALDDGSYRVRLRKAMYSFTVPETLTVSGTTIDTYTGTVITPAIPVPDLQSLYGVVVDPSLTGDSGAVITAEPQGINQDIDAQVISSQTLTDTTDAGGSWALSLAKGGRFKITGETSDGVRFLSRIITVSAEDTANVTDYF